MTRPIDTEPADEGLGGCGYEYDHTVRTTYDGPDGRQYECTECGAEWWEDDQPADAARVAEGTQHDA